MKYKIIFISLLYINSNLYSQSFLKSAGGTNGILFSNNVSSFNYNVADSKLSLTLKKNITSSIELDLNENNLIKASDNINDLKTYNKIKFFYFKRQNALDISIGAFEKGKVDLFKEAIFTPNLEISFTQHWTKFLQKNQSKFSGFIRPAISVLRRKHFVNDNQEVFKIKKKGAFDISLGFGFNYSFTEDLIFSVSSTLNQNWNSDINLKKKEHCIIEQIGVNSENQIVTSSKCEKLPFGQLDDITYTDLRMDALWRPNSFKTKGAASVGILNSLVIVMSDNKPSYSAAIGPAVFDKDNSGTIIFSVLIEFIDFNKSFTSTEDFDNIFGIRAYIGAPLSKLGTKKSEPKKEEVILLK